MPPIPTVRPNGPAIRTFRSLRGLTALELSEKSGVAPSAISYYERGLKQCSTDILRKLADGLDVPPQAICMDDLPDQVATLRKSA
ncbi:helix-turn-helix domain-containing protein [Thermomonospora umbrina]|uniref:Helix-turn-helix protein n=1 Tax=Thermomonospora umbrina TaxID=111806 RepID=A0A3D9T4R6_9ACTN|nr:helix-turn-helix transcriptional regulator [Thermomonospora umbrina]REF00236.1 helix-turn-helix protein [Thermomonospora umbrina]